MTDLSKHAEAILRAAFPKADHDSPVQKAIVQAILPACADLFDAGARAMQERCADDADRLYSGPSLSIRAIDPASLRSE